jgi:two-component system, cell cycle sensor histidine kinase and response regulator CckA
MPNGGVLMIGVQNAVLDERMRLLHGALGTERFVMISVKDTGIGIPKENLDKIFDPFFSTKGHEKGTGLGLSIIHTIVKNHGGFVDVESNPGRGAEFVVYLPVKEISDIDERHAEQRLPGGNGETILVVDDESCILELISASLKNRKYKVMTAADGAEAVALYAQKRGAVDLVIIDMLMPVMDGPTTVRALNVMDPKVKVIGMSGFVSDKQKGDADFPFADLPFIQKPFDVEQLLLIIDEVLHTASGPRKIASLTPRYSGGT